MAQSQGLGMQRRPPNEGRAPTVDRVAEDRVANVGEVNANLMRPAGTQRDPQQGVTGRQLQAAEFGDRRASVGDDRHPLPVLGIPADRRFDSCLGIWQLADRNRPVLATHASSLKLVCQIAMTLVVARDHHHAGGIPVESVDDPRSLHATDGRPLGTPSQQAMHQRAGPMSGARMDHQPRRFVDHQEVFVLEEDAELHWFREKPGWDHGGQLPGEAVARPQPRAGTSRPLVQLDVAFLDQLLHPGAAEICEQSVEVLVESRRGGLHQVGRCLGQDRLLRPGRKSPPNTRMATPTEIEESATLKIGQCGSCRKSMTEPFTSRS